MMETFQKILNSKATPMGAVAAAIFSVWQIAIDGAAIGLGYSLAVVALVGLVGHYWAKVRTPIPNVGHDWTKSHDWTKIRTPILNGSPSPKKRIRLAVAPLVPDPENDQVTIMGGGISEQVIRSLAQISDLEVIEERSISRLPKRKMLQDEIERELPGLDYYVDGTLHRDALDCFITAKMRRVSDWQILSTIEKQVPWNSLNQVPSSISECILNALNIQMTQKDGEGSVQVAVLQAGTGIAKAFEAYAGGKYHLRLYNNHRKGSNFKEAKQCFLEAISCDSNFADAYVELGFLHLIAWETESSEELLKESERYFRNALKYDFRHPSALAELGYISFLQGKTVEAVTQAQEAADESKPRAIPFSVLSLLYLYLGFWEESIRLTETINLLDPLYIYPYTNAALSCQLLGLHDESIKWAKCAARKGSGGFTSALLKGAAHFRANRFDKALESWREGRCSANDHEKFLFDIVAAWIPASQGKTSEVIGLVQNEAFEVWTKGAYSQFAISLLALAGEHERCLSLLEQEKTYTGSYRYLTADQTLRPLYSIPRFQTLLYKRYSVWLEHVHRWENELKRPPAPVRTPQDMQ